MFYEKISHLLKDDNYWPKFLDIVKTRLVIDKVPDIFVCGEMHRSDVSSYNGVLTINCSCWQAKTEFQEKTGNNPDPAKVPLLNLKTTAIKILNFGK